MKNKIDKETAHQIRIFYNSGKYNQTQLAEKFEVSQPLVSKIINGVIHKDNADIIMSGKANIKVGYKYGN